MSAGYDPGTAAVSRSNGADCVISGDILNLVIA